MEASSIPTGARRAGARSSGDLDDGGETAGSSVSFIPTSIADPGPLGLGAFALTTFILSMFNSGLVSDAGEPAVLGVALAYGGIVQLLAGMWEFRSGNTFGAVAFSSFGAFWISFWALVVFYAPKIPAADAGHAIGLYLFAWAIFTAYMTLASLGTNRAITAVFVALTLTFLFLALGDSGGHTGLTKVGGYLGLVTAVLAWYGSAAGVTAATLGRQVLPVGPWKAS